MRIAYIGLDEVNRYLTRRWARRIGAGICFVDVQTLSISPKCPAIVVDLDSLPATYRHRWVGWLTSLARDVPTLVFGHSMSDQEMDALRNCGVRVLPRALKRSTLQRWFVRELICAT